VHTGRRWYLIAYDVERRDWRTFRVDRLRPRIPTGPRFVPRGPPGDVVAYVSRSVAAAPYRYRARILMHAPVDVRAGRSSPTAGRLEAVDTHTCPPHTGSNSLDELALYVALKGVDFEVLEPPELVAHVAALGARLTRAAAPPRDRDRPASP
jgi:predicted DNA-binding transcriptional regulator YafY